MAHEITKKDVFAFTGARERIWHSLGEEIPEGLTAVEAFDRVGLGWETELLPCFAQAAGKQIILPNSLAHVRSDTLDVLGVVSDGYKPIDNGDVARFADQLLGADAAATISTCGSLLGGKRIFALLQLPKVVQAARGDDVNTYLALSNGHGGFASFNVYPTSVRIVCNNTLTWSEKDLGRGVRFHHTGDLEKKIRQAQFIMGLAIRETEIFEEKIKALVGCQLSPGQVRQFLSMAFNATFGPDPDPEREPEAFEKWESRRAAHLEKWMAAFEFEGQEIPAIRGTAWAALNAYTAWSDHERGGKWMDARPADHRTHSNLFGTASTAKTRMLTKALALV